MPPKRKSRGVVPASPNKAPNKQHLRPAARPLQKRARKPASGNPTPNSDSESSYTAASPAAADSSALSEGCPKAALSRRSGRERHASTRLAGYVHGNDLEQEEAVQVPSVAYTKPPRTTSYSQLLGLAQETAVHGRMVSEIRQAVTTPAGDKMLALLAAAATLPNTTPAPAVPPTLPAPSPNTLHTVLPKHDGSLPSTSQFAAATTSSPSLPTNQPPSLLSLHPFPLITMFRPKALGASLPSYTTTPPFTNPHIWTTPNPPSTIPKPPAPMSPAPVPNRTAPVTYLLPPAPLPPPTPSRCPTTSSATPSSLLTSLHPFPTTLHLSAAPLHPTTAQIRPMPKAPPHPLATRKRPASPPTPTASSHPPTLPHSAPSHAPTPTFPKGPSMESEGPPTLAARSPKPSTALYNLLKTSPPSPVAPLLPQPKASGHLLSVEEEALEAMVMLGQQSAEQGNLLRAVKAEASTALSCPPPKWQQGAGGRKDTVSAAVAVLCE